MYECECRIRTLSILFCSVLFTCWLLSFREWERGIGNLSIWCLVVVLLHVFLVRAICAGATVLFLGAAGLAGELVNW